MPTSSSRRRRSRSAKTKSGNPVDHLIAKNHATTVVSQRVTVASDFTQRPIRMNITQSPPRNLLNQIHWIQQSVTLRNNAQVSISNVEDNWSFKLGDLNQYATIAALFDQYCIYSVVFNVSVQPAQLAATTDGLGRITTAIDYDNVGNLGSEAALQQYSSAQTVEVSQNGISVQRYVKPCVTPEIYVVAGTGYGVGRVWLDTATGSLSVPHYGVRVYFYAFTTNNWQYDIIATYTIGCRNSL